MQSPYPIVFEATATSSFSKISSMTSSYFAEAKAVIGNARTFQDSLYFAKDNAMNGRAKTNFGFSRPDRVESK